MASADPQVLLQGLTDDFQQLQRDIQGIIASRQKLEGQKQENLGVQEEFGKLEEGETIYKLVGPVLLKQDKIEAEGTVKGRLDFISGEISRLEGQITELQDKTEKKKMEIIQLQSSLQSQAKPQAAG